MYILDKSKQAPGTFPFKGSSCFNFVIRKYSDPINNE